MQYSNVVSLTFPPFVPSQKKHRKMHNLMHVCSQKQHILAMLKSDEVCADFHIFNTDPCQNLYESCMTPTFLKPNLHRF